MRLMTAKTKVVKAGVFTLTEVMRFHSSHLIVLYLIVHTCKVLGISEKPMHLWTDSMVVLEWIRGLPSRWKTFIANRIVRDLNSLSGHSLASRFKLRQSKRLRITWAVFKRLRTIWPVVAGTLVIVRQFIAVVGRILAWSGTSGTKDQGLHRGDLLAKRGSGPLDKVLFITKTFASYDLVPPLATFATWQSWRSDGGSRNADCGRGGPE